MFNKIYYVFCRFFLSRQIGAGMSLPYWDFTGSTLVTSNYIRLTADIQSRSGAIWNSVVRIFRRIVSTLNCVNLTRKKPMYTSFFASTLTKAMHDTELGDKC